MTQTAPQAITDHYKVTMHSDDTICVVSCKYCLRQFRPVDRSGRRNWIGPMTHTMKHVNDVLRRRPGGDHTYRLDMKSRRRVREEGIR